MMAGLNAALDEDAYHKPVMVREIIDGLLLCPGKTVVDVTLGGGGHARAMLDVITPGGCLVGIDRDQDAIVAATMRLDKPGFRVRLVKGRMGEFCKILDQMGVGRVDAVVADLGVSSFQLDSDSRGFSFRESGPLDMRMDQSAGETAADFIKNVEREELEKIIREYGEERFAGRIARVIIENKNIETTCELAELIKRAVPPAARHGRIHPATRTFQALRIAVNGELLELERFLDEAPQRLSAGGRLAIISYHSLEDRRVKHAFRKLAQSEIFRLLVRRAVRPTEAEVKENPRARSAKLRILERING